MTEAVAILAMGLWVGLGGFAFAKMMSADDSGENLTAAATLVWFCLCLAFGPAMFGWWLAIRPVNRPTPSKEPQT